MLEVFSNFICFLMIEIIGFNFIKVVTKVEIEIFKIKNILILLIILVLQLLLYRYQYTGIYTITVYLLYAIAYKIIFNISIEKSIALYGIIFLVLFMLELIFSLILLNFITVFELRTVWYLKIGINAIYFIITLIIINSKKIQKRSIDFYNGIMKNKSIVNGVFFVTLIIGLSYLMYNISNSFMLNYQNIINIIIMVVCLTIAVMFINEKNNSSKILNEYDTLFIYVQNFEEWIEKEQLNRHEYKNQLAVLRCLTKESKVKNKIDEILEDSINIEGDIVNQLKIMPKGGLKGLMYYKTAIAQKHKINLTINISLDTKSKLNKLSEKEVRILCKLVGIYFDNAIEASRDTRKKVVLIEIYEFKDKIKFVFSNTFKQNKNIEKRNEKGVSTKGEGHGNGLYFASKLISKNTWLEQKQDIIDKYYIQELTIKNDQI